MQGLLVDYRDARERVGRGRLLSGLRAVILLAHDLRSRSGREYRAARGALRGY